MCEKSRGGEWGRTYERPGNDHVILGSIRGLGKNSTRWPKHTQTHKDMATLWLNLPSRADSVKMSGARRQVSLFRCQVSPCWLPHYAWLAGSQIPQNPRKLNINTKNCLRNKTPKFLEVCQYYQYTLNQKSTRMRGFIDGTHRHTQDWCTLQIGDLIGPVGRFSEN